MRKMTGLDNNAAPASTLGLLFVGGEYRASDDTYGDGDAAVLQMNVNGHLKVVTQTHAIDEAVYVDDADFNTGTNKGVAMFARNGSQSIDSSDVGVIACNSAGELIVQHNIEGIVSEINDDVDTAPEDLRAAGSVSCERVDMMADPSNTGYIWVGDSSVQNDGTGGGIRLGAGDFYSIDINTTGAVHVAATVANQKIMYTYYT
jgi:uncharacterized cupin superfamily protein